MINNYCTIIRNNPKADLHNHLTLGVKPKTVLDNFQNSILNIPKRYFGLPGMMNFIHKHVNQVMCDSESTIKFMELAIQDSINDNVVLLEASVDIKLVKYFNNSIESLIEVVKNLKEKYQDSIEFKPDLGIDKSINYSLFESYIYDCLKSGVYNGIDLYGIEKNRPLNHFRKLFDDAQNRGIKTKVHIGEFSNKDTIEEAIFLLEPDVIQHGIRAVQSDSTLEMIKKGILP